MKLDIEGIETLAAADRRQVLTTLGALFSGFAARDVDMLTGVYSDDADWVNAFRSQKTRQISIVGVGEFRIMDLRVRSRLCPPGYGMHPPGYFKEAG